MNMCLKIPFDEAFIPITVGKLKIKESEYDANGTICVVDQGQNLVSGMTNRIDLMRNNGPYIVFGDHTRVVKFVDFPFVVGADGIRLYKASEKYDPKFLYLFLKSSKLPEDGYGRHSKYLKTLFVPEISKEKQHEVTSRLKVQLAEVEKARQAAEVQLRDADLLVRRYRENTINRLNDVPRVPLGELLLGIEAGKSFQTSELLARPDELGVLKVSAVSWNEFLPQEAKAIDGVYEPDDRHRIKKGDLIISRANTLELVGAVVRVAEDYPLRLLSDKTLRLITDETKVSGWVN